MPHVVIMDLSMPGMGGIEAARQVRDKYGDAVRILIVTSNGYLRYVRQLTSFGVEGYLLKNTDRAELINAIRAVAEGKSFFSQAIKEAIVNDTLLKQTSHNGQHVPGLEALSKREIEIVKLLAKDLSTAEIADQLCLSTHTIETHRKNILSKLGVRSAVGVVRFAIEHNLVE
jgi:DNA-binding NarL/FixJ family response regulator